MSKLKLFFIGVTFTFCSVFSNAATLNTPDLKILGNQVSWSVANASVAKSILTVTGYGGVGNYTYMAPVVSTTALCGAYGQSLYYSVTVYDANGNYSLPSVAKPAICDYIAPKAPSYLQLIDATWNSVIVGWQPGSDNQYVAGYEIYRNGQFLDFVQPLNNNYFVSYNDTTVSPQTKYTYTIKTRDGWGNLSVDSYSVEAKTLITDLQPPSQVTGFDSMIASVGSYPLSDYGWRVWLKFNASYDNALVKEYHIFCTNNKDQFYPSKGTLQPIVAIPAKSGYMYGEWADIYRYGSDKGYSYIVYKSFTASLLCQNNEWYGIYAVDTSGNKSIISYAMGQSLRR